MSTESDPIYVDCGTHGKRVSAIVCRHLLKPEGERVGFIENSSDPSFTMSGSFRFYCRHKLKKLNVSKWHN